METRWRCCWLQSADHVSDAVIHIYVLQYMYIYSSDRTRLLFAGAVVVRQNMRHPFARLGATAFAAESKDAVCFIESAYAKAPRRTHATRTRTLGRCADAHICMPYMLSCIGLRVLVWIVLHVRCIHCAVQ